MVRSIVLVTVLLACVTVAVLCIRTTFVSLIEPIVSIFILGVIGLAIVIVLLNVVEVTFVEIVADEVRTPVTVTVVMVMGQLRISSVAFVVDTGLDWLVDILIGKVSTSGEELTTTIFVEGKSDVVDFVLEGVSVGKVKTETVALEEVELGDVVGFDDEDELLTVVDEILIVVINGVVDELVLSPVIIVTPFVGSGEMVIGLFRQLVQMFKTSV